MLWAGRRAPFTLLGGYLGAGKTTVVNHLVRNAGGRRLVVLVNDVGAVNVDADLIAAHDGTTLSLTNGCVCCSIADDLGSTLETIRDLPAPPDHVLMELSGVAEPARVAPWASTAGFRLDGIVVVAGADQLAEQVDRPFVGDTVRAQLAAADLVVLTKTDLAAAEPAIACIRSSTDVPIVPAVDGAVDPGVVLGIGADPPDRPPSVAPAVSYDVDTIAAGGLTVDALRARVEALDDTVVRAKGLVRCVDEAHPVEVHVVGRRRRIAVRPDLRLGQAADALVVIRLPAAPGPGHGGAGRTGRATRGTTSTA